MLVPWLNFFVSFSYVQRMTWVRRKFKSSVQPPSHNMANFEVRPVCSRIGLESLQGQRPHSPSGQHCPQGEKGFALYPLYPAWTTLVSVYAHCPSSSHHAQMWRAWFHLLNNPTAGPGGLLLGASKDIPASEWTSPQPLHTGQVFKSRTVLGSSANLMSF